MVPFDCSAHSLQKQFYPKTMVPMESRDSEGVPFASLENLWSGIWQMGAEKWSRDHHENRKFAYGKIHWFQKWYCFRSTTKNNEVISEKNRFYLRVSAVIATARWLAGWLAVCHSRYCIKTAKPSWKLFRPSESPTILVSWDPCADTKFHGEPLQRGR